MLLLPSLSLFPMISIVSKHWQFGRSEMKRPVNVGMFTVENLAIFNEKVDTPDENGCRKWLGSTTRYPDKNGKRRFGLFRRGDSGYVMNQRFAFIMDQPPNERDTGIKVEPEPTCKLGELCCNPSHIRPKRKLEPRKSREGKPARSKRAA